MAKSLAERLSAHEQEKARLAEKEAKLKADGRKAHNTRIYQAGRLVEKAGLLELEPNALYGALLSLKEGASGKEQVAQWAALGGRAFAREARLRDEGKEPIVLSFPTLLPKDATAKLRAAGFRFSKVFQHWEGMATPDEAAALGADNSGTVRRINAPAMPDSGQLGLPGKHGPTANDAGTEEPDDLLKRARRG